MEKVLFESEACQYLKLPKVPKKEWNGKAAFKRGVAVVETFTGNEAYAIATFNPEMHKEVQIIKVFSPEMFKSVKRVFVVPDYMDTNVEHFDLDDESKKKAQDIIDEASQIEESTETKSVPDIEELPEWIFDEIHSKDEATAWLKSYNKRNKIKADVPRKDENIKLRLYAIYTANFKKK